MNARHRRQFIPQGAISFVEIAVVFVDLLDVMIRSGKIYVGIYYLRPTTKVSFWPNVLSVLLFPHNRNLAKSTSSKVLYESRNPYI